MGLKFMQQAFLSQLKEGDRFYFPRNKKEICEFVKKEKKPMKEPEFFYKKGWKEVSGKRDLLVIYLRNKSI